MQDLDTLSIREPCWNDLGQFIELGKRLHAESWYAHIPYDENRVAAFFFDQVMNRDKNFCRVASRGPIILGAIAGSRKPYWFSTRSGVFDSFIYVVPSSRGTMIAYRLWKEMLAWSKTTGALELTHGVGTAIASDNAGRFFSGLGMTYVGGIYKMRLANGQM